MKWLTLGGGDHMDTGDSILASRLVADATDQFIFHGSRDSKKT